MQTVDTLHHIGVARIFAAGVHSSA